VTFLVALVVVVVLAAAAGLSSAHAWTAAVDSGGVTFTRSAEDTSACAVVVYTNAKGTTNLSSAQYASGFDDNRGEVNLETYTRSIRIPYSRATSGLSFLPGWGMLAVKVGGTTVERHVVYMSPDVADTEIAGYVGDGLPYNGLSVNLTPTSLPLPVALTGDTSVSVSADSTLPVSLVGVGSDDESSDTLGGALAVVMFLSGWMFMGAVRS